MEVALARPKPFSADGLLMLLALGLAGAGAYLLFTSVGTEQGATGWALFFACTNLKPPTTLAGPWSRG